MIDWDDLRYFLAVARHRTLSAAAHALGVSQPTVGRRLAAFETLLGARLFERAPDGFSLAASGRSLVAYAKRMETDAIAAERAVIGRDEGLTGTVRITAAEWIAVRLLPTALAPLLARNPTLSICVIADARHLNLGRREADLAIRPSAFQHNTVHQRRLGRVELALYASDEYLARNGASVANQAAGHSLIVMAADIGDVARSWIASHAKHAHVVARTNGREEMAAMAAAGIGLACLPRVVGDAMPALHRVPTVTPLPARTLWLGVHHDLRTVPRVRATIVALVTGLSGST